jgi:hypothetical protein
MLLPQSNKIILAQIPQTFIDKTIMYCTNCHRINYNVENCRVKRKEDFVLTISKVITQQIKVHRLVKYCCHICGDTRIRS